MAKQVESNFLVALNGVKLTDAQKQKINTGIQEVIMRELANIDHSEIVVKKQGIDPLVAKFKDVPFIWGIKVDLNSNVISVVNQQQNQINQ